MKINLSSREVYLISLSLGDESLAQEKLLKKMKIFDALPNELKNLQMKILKFRQEYRHVGLSEEGVKLVNEKDI